MLLQSDLILLFSFYYRSHSIVYITGFSSLVILLIFSLLPSVFSFFSVFFFVSEYLPGFTDAFSVYFDCFLCYQAIDLWCTNGPMIMPFGESCRGSCGYADCTDSLLLFDSFIDFNGFHSFSFFCQSYFSFLPFKMDSVCDSCFF